MTERFPAVAVLGLGNLLHSDDGVGVRAVERLRRDLPAGSRVTLLDGGTQGLSLLPHIAGFERLLVIDAVDVGAPPGTVVRFEGAALSGLPGKPSVHQLGFADMMIAMTLLGEPPPEVVVLGVQPLSTDWGAELTPTVEQSLSALVDAAIVQIESWASADALLLSA